MRHLFLFISVIAFTFFTTGNVQAQSGIKAETNSISQHELYDANGKLLGKVKSDGVVQVASGKQIGKIESNGTLRNERGAQVGKIETDGTIKDGKGSKLGQVNANGYVRDAAGKQIGNIDRDGTIKNAQGAKIGKATGNNKNIIGACYFFFFFKDNVTVDKVEKSTPRIQSAPSGRK